MIQKHRKPLFIETPAAEVKALAAALDPAGLAIRVGNLPGPGEADALHEWLSKRY
jgi:hypothetical protein